MLRAVMKARGLAAVTLCVTAAAAVGYGAFAQTREVPSNEELKAAIEAARPSAQSFAVEALEKAKRDGKTLDVEELVDRARRRGVPDPGAAASGAGIDLGALVTEFGKPAMEGPKPRNEKLMVFVSLSMPEKSLIQLSRDMRHTGGVMVLRGLVNNSIKETMPALQEIAKNGGRLVIDPTLYRDYEVDSVPTFIVSSGLVPACEDRACERVLPAHDRVKGDITLDAALETIIEGKGAARDVAADYRKRLGEVHK